MISKAGDESEIGLGDEEGGEASRERLTMAVRELFTCYFVVRERIIIMPQSESVLSLKSLRCIVAQSQVRVSVC